MISRRTGVGGSMLVNIEALSRGQNEAILELNRVDQEAERLHDEMYALAGSMSLDAHHGITTRYALDFDVIRSALDWSDERSYSQFWSAVSIHLGRTGIALLPGALFEMKSYLSDRVSAIEDRENNPFGKLFGGIDHARLLSISPEEGAYVPALEQFLERDMERRDQHIFRVIQQGLADAAPLPPLDQSIFRQSIEYLSRGTRADRWLNNRADGINYALTHKLNQRIIHDKIRYILVSNTRSVHRLDQVVCATTGLGNAARLFKSGLVRSARSAALHQLLLRAGGSPAEAETLAFRILSNIADYRARLREVLESYRLSSNEKNSNYEELSIDQLLIDIISTFDSVQQLVDIDNINGLEIEGAVYDANDPRAFYTGMEQYIDRRLRKSGYKLSFTEREIDNTPIRLLASASGSSPPTGYSLTDEFGTAIASIDEHDEVILHMPCKVTLGEFIDAINIIKAQMFSKLSFGSSEYAKVLDDDLIYIGVLNSEVLTKSISSRSDHSLEEFSKIAECLPSDITFLRLDSQIVSFSYEGDIIGISSKYKLPEEFKEFISSVIEPNYKSRDLGTPLLSYFKQTKYQFSAPELVI